MDEAVTWKCNCQEDFWEKVTETQSSQHVKVDGGRTSGAVDEEK